MHPNWVHLGDLTYCTLYNKLGLPHERDAEEQQVDVDLVCLSGVVRLKVLDPKQDRIRYK